MQETIPESLPPYTEFDKPAEPCSVFNFTNSDLPYIFVGIVCSALEAGVGPPPQTVLMGKIFDTLAEHQPLFSASSHEL